MKKINKKTFPHEYMILMKNDIGRKILDCDTSYTHRDMEEKEKEAKRAIKNLILKLVIIKIVESFSVLLIVTRKHHQKN